ncbi:hypothetical protein TNCT_364551 [Trichonephila clavata]|uniref:Uncharacterized protein n=1 Tax=Trichonephila clavata TaxID=2740835 RepID=A0A8X6HVS5_TRICU|nr:hypothetical protein TNCT_364551 [Trichonephila clavata]
MSRPIEKSARVKVSKSSVSVESGVKCQELSSPTICAKKYPFPFSSGFSVTVFMSSSDCMNSGPFHHLLERSESSLSPVDKKSEGLSSSEQ